MTLRDERSGFQQVVDVARGGLIGGALAVVALVAIAVRDWPSTTSYVLLGVAAVLAIAVILIGRRLLRD